MGYPLGMERDVLRICLETDLHMALRPLAGEDKNLSTQVDAMLRIDAVLRKYEQEIWGASFAPHVEACGNADGDIVITATMTVPADVLDSAIDEAPDG